MNTTPPPAAFYYPEIYTLEDSMGSRQIPGTVAHEDKRLGGSFGTSIARPQQMLQRARIDTYLSHTPPP